MKVHKELKLRPLKPAFLNVIPRLPAMVCKKEIIFKAFSPITYVFSAVQSIFKKRSAVKKHNTIKGVLKKRQLQEEDESSDEYAKDRIDGGDNKRKNDQEGLNTDEKSPDEQLPTTDKARPKVLKPVNNSNLSREEIMSYENWEALDKAKLNIRKHVSCFSCEEDRAAYQTCKICRKMKSSLPSSSCLKCQARGPVVKFCMRYHGKQPRIYLSNNLDNYKKFTSKRILPNRQAIGECNGKTPSIYNCPVCLTFWPMMGECSCRTCKKNQPIVKYSLPKYQFQAKVELCPCSQCSHLHPKIKICNSCRSKHSSELTRSTANSFYMILS